MTEQPGIREEVTRYEVCAAPAGSMDADAFVITVERWAEGFWTLKHRGHYYGADGTWGAVYVGRFTVDEALRLARELAPQVQVGGMNAAEYQVWARERVVGRG